MRHWIAALLIGCATSVCGLGCESSPSMEEVGQINERLAQELEKETGHEALITYYQDGSYLKITVRLVGASAAKADESRSQIEATVKRHWKSADEIAVETAPAD